MTSAQQQELAQTVCLPNVSYTRSGREFYPQEDIWKYKDGLVPIYMNFAKFPCGYEMRQSIKKVISWYAENRSPSYTFNLFNYLLSFFRKTYDELHVDVSDITSEMLLNYIAVRLSRQV